MISVINHKILPYSNINNLSFVELEIPEDVSIIMERSFCNCKNLTTLIIPETVVSIENEAFCNCENLTKVIFKGTPVIHGNIFKGCSKLRDIQILKDNIRVYSFDSTDEFAFTVFKKEEREEDIKIYIGRVFPGEGFPFNSYSEKKPLYFVETGNDPESVWFDTEVERAIIASKYKYSKKSFNDFFEIKLDDESEITYEAFSLLAGICDIGFALWKYSVGDKEKIKIKEIKRILDTNEHFAGVKSVSERFKEALDKQNQVFNNLNIHKTIPAKPFIHDVYQWLFKK